MIDALALGGAERMLVEIANRTVRDGHRVSVCVTRSETRMASRLHRDIELLVLGRRARTDLAPLWRLRRWIREAGVDVIHAHGRSSFSLLAVLRATRAITTPIVMHDHLGVQLHPAVPGWFRIARRVLEAYVAVDPAQLAWARGAGIPSERTRVIANAIDLDELSRQSLQGTPLPSSPGRARLICVGGIRRDKAIDVVLDAMTRVRAPAVLYVVGGDADPGYAQTCRVRAAAADLADRVVFVGERPDALALARSLDLAVHGARSESGPLVLAEYAALEVPFVATRVGAIAAALEAARAGRFVAADDPDALARAIDGALAMSPAERAQETAHAAATARGLFDIANVIAAWYRVYEHVRA